MDEPIVETSDAVVAKTEDTPPVVVAPEVPKPEPVAVEPKKKGRPAGAKDKAPRKKAIVIVEEPVEVEAPVAKPVAKAKAVAKPVPKAVSYSEPVQDVEPVEEEPPSPRTMMRAASQNILHLRNLSDRARKTYLQESYTKRLHVL